MEDWCIRVVGEDRVTVIRGVDRVWVADLVRAGFTLRTADVGGPALCEVAALTVVEARRFNATFLEKAQAKLDAVDAKKGFENTNLRQLYASPVALARSLAETLDATGDGSYYPNWVVVESMNID
jgi:hypothetical protein